MLVILDRAVSRVVLTRNYSLFCKRSDIRRCHIFIGGLLPSGAFLMTLEAGAQEMCTATIILAHLQDLRVNVYLR
jgi:hypothetical protein